VQKNDEKQKRTLYTHLKYGLKRSGAYKKETQKKKDAKDT
jgi:hypothetical protein